MAQGPMFEQEQRDGTCSASLTIFEYQEARKTNMFFFALLLWIFPKLRRILRYLRRKIDNA